MSKFSTLNYLISSYYAGKKEVESHQIAVYDFDNMIGFEPSRSSIDSILNFASQFEVLKSVETGNVELNLN